MHLLYLGWTHLPPASWPSVCPTPSSPPGHFQPDPPSALSLSHFFFHQLRCKIFYIHLQCSLLYYPRPIRYEFTMITHLYKSGKKFYAGCPFVPQPSPFIRAWDRHQETQKFATDGWVSI